MRTSSLLLATLIASCALLSSCKPPPISGHVSVVTPSGANLSLGMVQVAVINAKDADDYMAQCQGAIDAKTRALATACDNAKTDCDSAVRVASQTRTAATKAELEAAKRKLNAAAAALQNFPTADDYFNGFMPSPIETTMTDVEGDFTIDRPKQAAKIFAKAQRQGSGSVENYFWLVDLPQTGDTLILSNTNMFQAPRAVLP